MQGTHRLTDQELAEIQRRRAAVRASFACEGIFLTEQEEDLFSQMDEDRLSPDDGAERILLFNRLRRIRRAAQAAE